MANDVFSHKKNNAIKYDAAGACDRAISAAVMCASLFINRADIIILERFRIFFSILRGIDGPLSHAVSPDFSKVHFTLLRAKKKIAAGWLF